MGPNGWVDVVFRTMVDHGEKYRAASAGGTLILSSLPSGLSLIRAQAPSVKFVLQGEETYEVGGRTRRVRAGEFMLVEPGAVMEVSTRGSDQTIGLCVYLPADLHAPENSPEEPALFSSAILGCSADPLAGMLTRYGRLLASEPEAGHILADQIVRRVSRASDDFVGRFTDKLGRLGAQKPATRVEALHRLERARAFIHENAQRAVSLDEIGRHATMSRFYLARNFTEVYGAAPLAYHRRLRLEAAARRLKQGDCSPGQMSEELGYSNPSAFTRAFVQAYGIPPSQAHRLAWSDIGAPSRTGKIRKS